MKKLIIAGIIAVALGAAVGIAGNTKQSPKTTAHIVEENETLWDIASANTDDNTDVRLVIDKIIEINKLAPNAAISPGQRLIIPVNK